MGTGVLTWRLLHPACTRMAKSPSSCGSSCSRTVTVVTIPSAGPARKDAPMAKPSVTLWATSATRFRYPDTPMPGDTGTLGTPRCPCPHWGPHVPSRAPQVLDTSPKCSCPHRVCAPPESPLVPVTPLPSIPVSPAVSPCPCYVPIPPYPPPRPCPGSSCGGPWGGSWGGPWGLSHPAPHPPHSSCSWPWPLQGDNDKGDNDTRGSASPRDPPVSPPEWVSPTVPMTITMTVTVATPHVSHERLQYQEGDNPGQDPRPHSHHVPMLRPWGGHGGH